MVRSTKGLGIDLGNRQTRFDIYYNLPERLERWNSNRPDGMKHAKSTDADVAARSLFFKAKGVY